MAIRRLKDMEVKGKRVLCRADFNVTLDKQTGQVDDDTRVTAVLPTIRELQARGARVVLCSHFQRPKGKRVPEMSLRPVAANLSRHLGREVPFAEDCVGEPARAAVAKLKDGEALLLENLRFHKGEEADDADFARQLAELADVYVNDAFGAAHRAHASVHALPRLMPARCAGLLMMKEIDALAPLLAEPRRPFVAILGGAKISGKLQVLKHLLPKCDAMLIGGGMAYTFLKAQGLPVGKSLVEADLTGEAAAVLEQARKLGRTLLLPLDHVVAEKFEAQAPYRVVPADGIPDGWMALDIGPRTVERYTQEIAKAATVVWNGPQGVFELPPFNAGTFAVAKAVAGSQAFSVVGGGESVAAVNEAGVSERISHISTGGGASLEFLEGQKLPGIAVLES
ncbi:MAG: phosphoglycerate kinase [Planctomycetota bacterium]|nr:phosphoglycerate kinase [Planctomycetota bacterium]